MLNANDLIQATIRSLNKWMEPSGFFLKKYRQNLYTRKFELLSEATRKMSLWPMSGGVYMKRCKFSSASWSPRRIFLGIIENKQFSTGDAKDKWSIQAARVNKLSFEIGLDNFLSSIRKMTKYIFCLNLLVAAGKNIFTTNYFKMSIIIVRAGFEVWLEGMSSMHWTLYAMIAWAENVYVGCI